MGPQAEVLAVAHEVLAVADVVKASAEDVGWLEPGRDLADVASAWQERGPSLVVITRGGDGALAVGRSGTPVERPGRAVAVVDTVGAGDSFMSALLAGLARRDLLGVDRRTALAALTDDELAALLDEAIEASAVTCSRPGADPPRLGELSYGGPAR
jgi:fructokinase